MADERTRELERVWNTSGSPADRRAYLRALRREVTEAEWLRRRIASGDIEQEKLGVLAFLGDEAAREVLGDKVWLSRAQVAEVLKISPDTLSGWVRNYGCPAERKGTRYRLDLGAVLEWKPTHRPADLDGPAGAQLLRGCHHWGPGPARRAVLAVSRQVLPLWEAAHPDEPLPGQAIAAMERLFEHPTPKNYKRVAKAASDLESHCRPPAGGSAAEHAAACVATAARCIAGSRTVMTPRTWASATLAITSEEAGAHALRAARSGRAHQSTQALRELREAIRLELRASLGI